MESEKHVLVIFPHPDDESFGVSGTIAMYTQNKVPVTYVCCTLGEMGRNMGNPPFANRESLPLIRKQELEKACEVLGITDLRLLGLRDKTLEFEDLDELANYFSPIIDEIKPSLIITFYPGYSVHPDHDACGAAVIHAVKRLPKHERPTIHCVAFSNNCVDELGPPQIVRDVSAYANIKIKAIQAHKSQFGAFARGRAAKHGLDDRQVQERIQKEYFWIYQWSD